MENTNFKYPPTRMEDIADDYHGVLVGDPYRWLEDDCSPDTAAWVSAQNELTERYLVGIPFREKIRERLTELWDYPKEGIPQKKGGWYYFARNDGLRNQSVIYRSRTIGSAAEVFLDPNTLSDDGTVALNGLSFSDDGRYCAYSVSASGSDWAEIRIVETGNGMLLNDIIRWVKFSIPSWDADSSGFYYSAYDAPANGDEYSGQNRFHKVFYHKIGHAQQDDVLIYADDEHPLRYFHGSESHDGRWIFVHGSEGTHGAEILFRRKDDVTGGFEVLMPGFEHDYEIVYANEDRLFLMTNRDAPNFKVIAVDLLSSAKSFTDVVRERIDAPLESVSAVGGYLMATYLENAVSAVWQFDMEGRFVRNVAFDGLCTSAGFTGGADDKETFYALTTYTSPAAVYRYELETGLSSLVSRSETGFDGGAYVTEQLFFESFDGTRVPMFVTHRKDMSRNGRNLLVMCGYGGFNISHTPAFNPAVIMLLEQGGVFVDVTLRGGGEYGERWHHAGMLAQKQNVFDDFIAAAEYLIAECYTSSDKLAIMGGSNGGLLVGACMTQRPDLFAVAVPQVGVLDMLRYHRFTIGWGWVVEYGSAEDPDQFCYLYRYSPLHNVRDGVCYPATFVTTAEHDDRVVPAHSFKFAAALQRAQGCGKPVLIRIERDAGHGAGKPTSKRIAEQTDVYSFIFQNTGIVFKL